MSGNSDFSSTLTPTGRVPAEHRVFGLDRRTLLPGLIVIGVFLLWAVVMPAINGLISYSETTKAGDVFALGPGLTMEAQEGWGVEKGLLTTEDTRSKSAGGEVVLVSGGLSFKVRPGPYEGSLEDLLSQIDKVTAAQQGKEAFNVADDVQSFHTAEGHPGVAQTYTTVEGEGLVAALQYEGVGLEIVAAGPDPQPKNKAEQIAEMIDSIKFEKSGGEG